MAGSTLTTVAYIYKRLYSDKAVGDLAMRDHPLFKMIKKEDGFKGSAFFYAMRTGNPQSIAVPFATAQSQGQDSGATGTGSSKGKQLQADRKKLYAVITLDGESLMAARGDSGAFLDLVRQETDGVLEEMGDTLAFELFRDKYALRGQRASISTNTVTLVVADDARNFKVGMTVGAIDSTLATLRSGTTYVTSVDEDAGTVTLNSAAAITSFSNNDYLFRAGDVSSGPTANSVEGLASIIPLTSPAPAENFRGIDRSTDPRRLAGVRFDNAGNASIEEDLGSVAVKISQVGKRADVAFLNPVKFWEVSRRLNAKVTYDGGGVKASAYFQGFDIHTPAGAIRVVSDPDCPTNRGYVLNLDTWYLKTLGGLPHIIKEDGLPTLRSAAEDSIESRARAMWNVVCTEPGANGVFSI